MILAALNPSAEFYELGTAVATPIIFIIILFAVAWLRRNGM